MTSICHLPLPSPSSNQLPTIFNSELFEPFNISPIPAANISATQPQTGPSATTEINQTSLTAKHFQSNSPTIVKSPTPLNSKIDMYTTLLPFRRQIVPILPSPEMINVNTIKSFQLSKLSKIPITNKYVNQTLERPVNWNDEQFEVFKSRRPCPDAECEICCEKVVMIDECDVQYLKNTILKFDTCKRGSITQNQMKQLLSKCKIERPTLDTNYFETFLVQGLESIDYNEMLDVTTRGKCCQNLCLCRPPRWLHSKCMNAKLSMGINGAGAFLLKCGYCRAPVWGTKYVQWLEEARLLLNSAMGAENKLHRTYANQAYELAVDTLHAVIRCGGGAEQNAILGTCLTTIASAELEKQLSCNGGYPKDTKPGEIYRDALLLGSPPTMRGAWIMGEMRWVQELTTEEKQVWLNLGIDMVKQVKHVLPISAISLRIRASTMELEFLVLRPLATLSEVMEVIESWPWDVEAMDEDACYSVCSIMAENFGLRYMGKYFLHGFDLNEDLFEDLNNELQHQIQDDINWMKSNIMESTGKVTDEDRVELGDEWDWEKQVLDIEVIERLIQAYSTLRQYEKAAMWQKVIMQKVYKS